MLKALGASVRRALDDRRIADAKLPTDALEQWATVIGHLAFSRLDATQTKLVRAALDALTARTGRA
jgi:hypothetical protein